MPFYRIGWSDFSASEKTVFASDDTFSQQELADKVTAATKSVLEYALEHPDDFSWRSGDFWQQHGLGIAFHELYKYIIEELKVHGLTPIAYTADLGYDGDASVCDSNPYQTSENIEYLIQGLPQDLKERAIQMAVKQDDALERFHGKQLSLFPLHNEEGKQLYVAKLSGKQWSASVPEQHSLFSPELVYKD